jgi:hypothetical protein
MHRPALPATRIEIEKLSSLAYRRGLRWANWIMRIMVFPKLKPGKSSLHY